MVGEHEYFAPLSIPKLKHKKLKNTLDLINMTKSKLLYNLYKNNKLPKNVKDRCCNFPLLEEKCNEYNKIININK